MSLDLTSVTEATEHRAARVIERCSHTVVGFVTQHRALAKRAIVVEDAVRWFPNDDEFESMMGWKKYATGPGVPHDGWPLDASPALAPIAAPAAVPPTPMRPVLTAPPSAKVLESTEAALCDLARELGCVRNDDIPHNAGWFVPGKPTAYASAYDAIRGLVASLKGGGTVYEGKSGSQEIEISAPEPVAPKRNAPAPTIEQGALF